MENKNGRKSISATFFLHAEMLLELRSDQITTFAKKELGRILSKDILNEIEIKERSNPALNAKEFSTGELVLVPKEEYERMRKVYELFWRR